MICDIPVEQMMTPFLGDIHFGFFCRVLVMTWDELHHAPCKLCIFLRKGTFEDKNYNVTLKHLDRMLKLFNKLGLRYGRAVYTSLAGRLQLKGSYLLFAWEGVAIISFTSELNSHLWAFSCWG